jgi:hypothetical protein
MKGRSPARGFGGLEHRAGDTRPASMIPRRGGPFSPRHEVGPTERGSGRGRVAHPVDRYRRVTWCRCYVDPGCPPPAAALAPSLQQPPSARCPADRGCCDGAGQSVASSAITPHPTSPAPVMASGIGLEMIGLTMIAIAPATALISAALVVSLARGMFRGSPATPHLYGSPRDSLRVRRGPPWCSPAVELPAQRVGAESSVCHATCRCRERDRRFDLSAAAE